MFIEKLLNQGSGPTLSELLKFTSRRHRLLAENIVNIDVPGYQQKDLSLEKFQKMMRDRIEQRRAGQIPDAGELEAEIESPNHGILFHDGTNRSVEMLMSDQAKNALMHNMVVELLRKQFGSMESALKERVG